MIVRLGCRGKINKTVIDTSHFKGNYPDHFSLEGADMKNIEDFDFLSQKVIWENLLGPEKLNPNKEHFFSFKKSKGPFTHVKLNIFPDGGIARLRLFGFPV